MKTQSKHVQEYEKPTEVPTNPWGKYSDAHDKYNRKWAPVLSKNASTKAEGACN